MYTKEQIANQGLALITGSRVQTLDPPSSPLEAHIGSNYATWKRSELTKRVWNFALVYQAQLTITETKTHAPDGRPYVYLMPKTCIRALRDDDTEWVQRGRNLYSAYNQNFYIDYIDDVPEDQFDELFADVLAHRIAIGSTEHVNQSNVKKATLKEWYDDAVNDASRANAFAKANDNISDADHKYPWLAERWNGGGM